jgi:large subunit ribosomal protein L29
MKAVELRELSDSELKSKINEFEGEFFNLRFQDKMGQINNPVRKRHIGRDIARAKTVLKERLKTK